MTNNVQERSSLDELDEGPGETRQFVIFTAGNEVFAIDMAPVQEIIRLPAVVRVPLAPPALDGLANLRGQVLPIVSLRRIFGFGERDYDDATRALVIDLGQRLGFVVDRVASVVGIELSRIEGVEAIRCAVNTDLLSGIIKNVGEHPIIMVLDFAKLIAREFAQMDPGMGKSAPALGADTRSASDSMAPASEEVQLVSFDVADQEYAIAIEFVQEIVHFPVTVMHAPNSAPHVIGVMTLRNRLLPLVSLRRMFSLPAQDANEHSRVVVVSVGDSAVGVVTDSVNQVLRVARADIAPMPGLLKRESALADISEICRLEQGRRLVSIISASNLFGHSSVKETLESMDRLPNDKNGESPSEPQNDMSDDEQVVIFRLAKEEFGVPIDSVQEIVRVPENLTHVPTAPSFVEGVINLRGAVLPVIDLRRRLGLPAVPPSDRQRVIVFFIGGIRTGFIVDSVAEVLMIPKHAIAPAPQLSPQQGKLLARTANLEKQQRMVQLIDPNGLVELADIDELSNIAG